METKFKADRNACPKRFRPITVTPCDFREKCVSQSNYMDWEMSLLSTFGYPKTQGTMFSDPLGKHRQKVDAFIKEMQSRPDCKFIAVSPEGQAIAILIP